MNATSTKTNERLRSLSPAIQRPRQGIIWSRNNSKTDLLYNYKYQQKIKQLKEEIKQLKQTENNQQEERREIHLKPCKLRKQFPGFWVSLGPRENIKLVNIINFI